MLILAALLLLPAPGDIEVPHEHLVLDNGLHVILAPDRTLPRVEINLWYQVGSKNEEPGRSGFAHLFEHLMFMGTQAVEGGRFDELMEAGGARNNATTSYDRTNYFDWGPSGMLETMLWLEADRMAHLGEAITQEKLDLQRDVVRNERRQRSENTPYGQASLLVNKLMYPTGHPYHISVIGTHEDLEAATLDDVRDFFERFYVPNNCSLVLVGDFEKVEALEMIERHFGGLAPGPEPRAVDVPPFRLDGPRHVVLEDRVQHARLSFLWHSPPFFQPGDAEMDLLAGMLAGGKSGRLTRRLVLEDRTAVDVRAYQSSGLLGSLFQVHVYAMPGTDLEALAATVDEELERFTAEGPSEGELARAGAVIRKGTVSSLESQHARADSLNRYLMHLHDPDGFAWDLKRYQLATAADVQQWAQRVLDPGRRLIMTVLPPGQSETHPELDRQPAVPEAGGFDPPVPVAWVRPSGLQVWHLERHGLPLASIHLVLEGGRRFEAPGEAGLAELSASMLDEGAGDLDAPAFAVALEALGASLSVRAGARTTLLSMDVLSENLEESLPLFHDALVRPRFDPDDFERVRRLQVEGLRRAMDDPSTLARQVAAHLWYGPAHPYGRPADGHAESVEKLTVEQARAYHARQARPQGALLAVAGDVTREQVEQLAERLDADWPAMGPPPGNPEVPVPEPTGVRVVLLHRPGAPQTVLRFVMPGHASTHPDRLPSTVLNTILGGSFTSRLNHNIREEHGYSYGAGSGFARHPDQGVLVAQSAVRTDVTGAAIGEFLKEFRRLRQGDVTAAEADAARAIVLSGMVSGFEGLRSTVGTWLGLRDRGAAPADVAADLAALPAIDAAGLNELAARSVPLEAMLLVMVGDADVVLPQLEDLDLPPVDVRPVPRSLLEISP